MASRGVAGSFWDDQFRSIFDSSPDAVIAIDTDGQVVDWSANAAQIFGWRRDEAVGRALVELIIPPEHAEAHRSGLRRFRATGAAPVVGRRVELTALRRDGSQFPIELSITKIEWHGQTFFNAFLRDITKWRQREEQHHQRVMQAEILEQTTASTATAATFKESLQLCLETICQQIGWPVGHVWMPDETGQHLVSTRIWRLDEHLQLDEFRRVTENMRLRSGEGLPGIIWQREQPIWIEDLASSSEFVRAEHCSGLPLRAGFGFPVMTEGEVAAVLEFFHTSAANRDARLLSIGQALGNRIGEVVRSRRFEQQRARLAAIVASSYDAIIGKALDGTITSWNAGAERMYGFSESEAVGRTIGLILPPGADGEEEEIRHAIETGHRLEQFETLRRRKDGRLIHVSLTVSPIAEANGLIVGSSSVERDITDRMRNQQELQAARDSAVRANQARAEFLANVSHELRTPMNAIIGMSEIALEEELPENARSYIQTANEAAHSLLTLLNDILDFSKLESGKFTIDHKPFELRDVIDETVKTLSSQAFAKGIELACDVAKETPKVVVGDSIRLRQILTNLVSNAIKFTEDGEVVVRVETIRKWPNEVRLRFVVSDTGIGISPADQQRILQPFTQADSSSTRQHGGTGLGLAICSELLRLLGGRLTVESEVGRGSRFSVRLSFGLTPGAYERRSDSSSLSVLQDLPVLVVDDNATNRQIVAETLSHWSMRPLTAEDGAQALQLCRKAREDGVPSLLVIVDARMPGLDGYQLSRQIRAEAGHLKTAVILMVSVSDRDPLEDAHVGASIAAVLRKPVSQSDLMDAVMRALEHNTPPLEHETAERNAGRSTTPLNVLLAEDTPANQKVVTTVLERRGHAVTVANNGREAVECFERSDFDVVLMDVQMPVLDGFEATAAIRELARGKRKSTPIIAMTAHAMQGDRERCLAAGMDAYIAKPLDLSKLLGLVESIPGEDTETATDGNGFDGVVVDFESAMRRLSGDLELFREFIGFYDEDAWNILQEIEHSVAAGDPGRLHRSAHSLKGLAANLGGETVVEAAAVLEQLGQTGEFVTAHQALANLQLEMKRLNSALQHYRS